MIERAGMLRRSTESVVLARIKQDEQGVTLMLNRYDEPKASVYHFGTYSTARRWIRNQGYAGRFRKVTQKQ